MNPERIAKTNRAFAVAPAAPGAGETVVLFCTHPRAPGGVGTAVQPSILKHGSGDAEISVNPDSIRKVTVVYHLHDMASAANGVRAYQTTDGGATWEETDMKGYVGGVADQPSIGAAAPVQVPALIAGQEWVEEFIIDRYRGVALEHTAGATGPTPGTGWKVSIPVEFVEQED